MPDAESDAGVPFLNVTMRLCSSGHHVYRVTWADGTVDELHEGRWPNSLNPAQRGQLRRIRTRVTPPAAPRNYAEQRALLEESLRNVPETAAIDCAITGCRWGDPASGRCECPIPPGEGCA